MCSTQANDGARADDATSAILLDARPVGVHATGAIVQANSRERRAAVEGALAVLALVRAPTVVLEGALADLALVHASTVVLFVAVLHHSFINCVHLLYGQQCADWKPRGISRGSCRLRLALGPPEIQK